MHLISSCIKDGYWFKQHTNQVQIHNTHLVSFGTRWSFQSKVAFLSFRPRRPQAPTWPFWSTLTNFTESPRTTLREERRDTDSSPPWGSFFILLSILNHMKPHCRSYQTTACPKTTFYSTQSDIFTDFQGFNKVSEWSCTNKMNGVNLRRRNGVFMFHKKRHNPSNQAWNIFLQPEGKYGRWSITSITKRKYELWNSKSGETL